jgi:hypothetical protein
MLSPIQSIYRALPGENVWSIRNSQNRILFGDLNINYSRGKIIFKSGLNKNYLTEVGFILVLERPCNTQRSALCDVVTLTSPADRLLQSTPFTQLLNNTPIADCSTICNQPHLQSVSQRI